jgi:hypothetical protein
MVEVRIELRETKGRTLWRVCLGRRTLTFHEELAARTFAAQLHQRLSWLGQQLRDGGNQEQP